MGYKLTETAIADGWVLFKDRFPAHSDLVRGKFVNVMFGDGSMASEEVDPKTKEIVSAPFSMETIVAWQTPKPLRFVKEEAYTAIEYGGDGLWAVKRNADGFIRAWDIPSEHHAKRIAEEYNLAKKQRSAHERQV
jgi:hypothetical protein